MNLHEYQAKKLLEKYGMPVPEGEVVSSADEGVAVYSRLGTGRVVAKAQVHAGGRGLAGGVRIVDNKQGLIDIIKELIGTRLVTAQTTADGQPVSQILIEAPCVIKKEYYLGAVVDREQKKTVIMCSDQGGVEIEEVAEKAPEKIHQFTVDPLLGVMPYQCRDMAYSIGLKNNQIKQFTDIVMKMGKLFVEKDLSMLEINPLVLDDKDALVCLDAKISVDGNALYRQKSLRTLRDQTQEDERENRASLAELNYIALVGDIGCMVNGAGLAMATMDLIKLHGGKPANFLDVGGGATKDRVVEAFKIILSDQQVKAILVNIFGGIVRCDLIADGIIGAIAEVDLHLPVIVRLEGNNAELGLKKLAECGLNIIAANSFDEAAKQAVKAAQGEKAKQ